MLVASLWIQYLGVADTLPGDLLEHLQKEQISFDVLLKRDKFDLRSLRFPTAVIEPLAAALYEYREFSSVEGKRLPPASRVYHLADLLRSIVQVAFREWTGDLCGPVCEVEHPLLHSSSGQLLRRV